MVVEKDLTILKKGIRIINKIYQRIICIVSMEKSVHRSLNKFSVHIFHENKSASNIFPYISLKMIPLEFSYFFNKLFYFNLSKFAREK